MFYQNGVVHVSVFNGLTWDVLYFKEILASHGDNAVYALPKFQKIFYTIFFRSDSVNDFDGFNAPLENINVDSEVSVLYIFWHLDIVITQWFYVTRVPTTQLSTLGWRLGLELGIVIHL